MVGATHSRVGDGSAARSAARRRNDTAMERRGAQAFSDRKEGPRRKAHVWALRGAPFPRRFAEEGIGRQAAPGLQLQGRSITSAV